jgi:hypothetical protein
LAAAARHFSGFAVAPNDPIDEDAIDKQPLINPQWIEFVEEKAENSFGANLRP